MPSVAHIAALIRSSNLFNQAFYQAQIVARLGSFDSDPILHYILEGEASGLCPHPLFDPSFYARESGRTTRDGNLLAFYLDEGWRLSFRPHPLFDNNYYSVGNPDILKENVPPLCHFLASGGIEGRNPHPLFHSWYYTHTAPGLLESQENPLLHYLRTAGRAQMRTHPAFDGAYYLATNPDVAASGATPLLHFVTVGLAEGRRPDWNFSPSLFAQSGADAFRLTDEKEILAATMAPLSSEDDYNYLSAEIERRQGARRENRSISSPGTHPRVVAFYLPQFHPIPANDANWGEGFTEWVNVRRAVPNFAGHDQPREPAELDYYDLRDDGIMQQQAALARKYGVSGFCFYWYWFNGAKPLAMPLERMLGSGLPDFPFCLCWANEGWTRKWAGGDQVIYGHEYSETDDRAHAAELARYMRDPRYIRISGSPLLLIYRADGLPNSADYLVEWRKMFAAVGIPAVHFAMVESATFAWANQDPRQLGFDSSVEFPPHGGSGSVPAVPNMLNPSFKGAIFDFRETVLRYATAPLPNYPRSRTVMAGWDNTARYQDTPAIFMNATPGGYRAWLEGALRDVQATRAPGEQLVFVNAWNEWGEGTYLEPDKRWGHGYLKATQAALATVDSDPAPDSL